jgi:hypothetical protein
LSSLCQLKWRFCWDVSIPRSKESMIMSHCYACMTILALRRNLQLKTSWILMSS